MHKSSHPKVSIIIPVYNARQYLSKCLDSVLSQTLQEIDVICIDDGSNDGSYQILTQYASKDPRLRVVSKGNEGQGATRNLGLKMAAAPYVGFVDADDWIEPDIYETAWSLMSSDDQLDYVSWGINVIAAPDDEDAVLLADGLRMVAQYFSGKKSIDGQVAADTMISPCVKLYKMDLIKQHEVTFSEGIVYEDAAFWWKYAAWAKYGYYLQAFAYNYLQTPSSTMRASAEAQDRKAHDRLTVVRHILSYYEENNLPCKKDPALARMFEIVAAPGLEASFDKTGYTRAAKTLALKYGLEATENRFVKEITAVSRRKYTWLELLFSVKNTKTHKVICLLGLKIKIRR